MTHRIPILALVASLAACSAAPPPELATPTPPQPSAEVAKSVAPSPPPAPPTGVRLPRTARPTAYKATLTVVPGDDVLRGEIDIALSIAEPTRVIWLNAEDLHLDEARLEANGQTLRGRVVPGGKDVVGIAFDAPAPAGAARLRVVYRGAISTRDDHGAFREDEGGASYVFTQFEAIAARRVFPCIDDPGIKVPWDLSLRVPKDLVALANAPVLSETPEEGGKKLVRFATTKPLPSYLVAFAVGPFDLVDAGTAGKNKTAVRIAVPRGKGAQARYAAKTTGPLLALLEDYLGSAYPYEKLDVVSVPRLATFGAMENPGLITYGASGSLAQPHEETVSWKRGFAGTMAHELAHQWFGDLVTMDFWDDIWLNEGFATWMSSRIIERFEPAWHEDARRIGSHSWAMAEDGLLSARKVRQEIHSNDDIVNAFDSITYSKGAALLGMFEAWAGQEKFQKGIRRYLDAHAHKNATSADFLAALGAETGKDIAPAFSSFLDQAGVPLVRAEIACDKGKPPAVRLSQERWLPAGSAGKPEQTWGLPVCLRYGKDKAEGRACVLVDKKTAEVPLPEAKQCPTWVALKEGGHGYYRAAYGREALSALLGKGQGALALPERVAAVRDIDALVTSGAMPAADALALVPGLVKNPEPIIERSALSLVFGVREAMVPAELRPNFARFVARTFGKRTREVGFVPRTGEDEETSLLRPGLVMLVAERGEDKALVTEAGTLAQRWLDDSRAVPQDIAWTALTIAARNGGRPLFDRVRAELKKPNDQQRRNLLLSALTNFRDPALVNESLALMLGDELDPRERMRMLWREERALDLSLAFVEKNFSALRERVSGEAAGNMPGVFGGFCDDKHREEVSRVFKDRVSTLVGGPRNLAQALESISLCAAQRRAQESSLRAFLGKF
jgi:alanyl aminopeptidase